MDKNTWNIIAISITILSVVGIGYYTTIRSSNIELIETRIPPIGYEFIAELEKLQQNNTIPSHMDREQAKHGINMDDLFQKIMGKTIDDATNDDIKQFLIFVKQYIYRLRGNDAHIPWNEVVV